jgi:hypothetical protein
MKEKINSSKLDTKLVPGEIGRTCTKKNSASQKARPRFKIKFTDYAIEKYTSSFIDPITNKTKYRVYTTFDVSRNTILKGLKLCQFEKSKTKWFVLNYWYQQKSHFITIGQFVPGKFGVKQCEDEIYKLAREHQNDKDMLVQAFLEKKAGLKEDPLLKEIV